MAKQRVINTYFWSDDFILDLRADEKLVFLYVLTNPQTDLCGAYQIAMQKMVFETRLSEKRLRTILDTLEKAGKVCYRNGWMVVKNFTKHQSSSSVKVAKGIERSLSHCPDWVKELLTIGFDRVLKGVTPEPELLPEPEPTDVCVPREPDRVTEPTSEENQFVEEVFSGLRSRFNLNTLRDEQGWLEQAQWAFQNSFPPTDFLECFDLLSRQKWRDGRVTPKNVGDNLPDLEKLRIKEQANGTDSKLSEREKSRDRSINAERLAQSIETGVFGSFGEDHRKDDIPRQLPDVNGTGITHPR